MLKASSFVLACERAVCVHSPYSLKSRGGSQMSPNMGIPLNGLFAPSNRPLPLDFLFYLGLPFLLGYPMFIKMVEVGMDNLRGSSLHLVLPHYFGPGISLEILS